MSVTMRSCHTADLTATDRADIRELLFGAFTGEDAMTEQDFDHCLGGIHVLLREQDGDTERAGAGALLAHGSVVARRMLHGDRSLRTGYVEVLAVRADRRRQGLGGTVMAELERIVRGGYELGALGATEDGARLYETRGWHVWRGTTSVVSPEGRRRTPDADGYVYVLPVISGAAAEVDEDGDLACDWRGGDVW